MRSFAAIVFIGLITSCSTLDYTVEYDYSYHGNFTKYKTFDFAENLSFSGSENERKLVEKWLNNTLVAWGYTTKKRRPDLLIFYSFYYDDLEFRGFEQPQFQSWLKHTYADQEVIFKKDTLPAGGLEGKFAERRKFRLNEEYDPIVYKFQEGTVLVSFYDRRKHRMVWQGYASGVFGQDSTKNERILRSAIIRILDEYKLLASL